VLLSERIQQVVDRLPALLQTEALHFVEYLAAKADREERQKERQSWSALSLSTAMRGMEDEDTPTYSTADLKVVFS
jgi:hypothetical protein